MVDVVALTDQPLNECVFSRKVDECDRRGMKPLKVYICLEAKELVEGFGRGRNAIFVVAEPDFGWSQTLHASLQEPLR